MKMKSRTKLIVLCTVLGVLIFCYIALVLYNFMSLKKYENEFLPNTYIEEFDMSHYSFDKAHVKIDFYNDYILSKKIVFVVNDKEYSYTLKDLGVTVNLQKTVHPIQEYQKSLSYSKKIQAAQWKKQSVFPIVYDWKEDSIRNVLSLLKPQVEVAVLNGYFDTSNGVVYQKGVDGFSLSIDKSLEEVKKAFSKEIKDDMHIVLVGDVIPSSMDEGFATIDTMTSSFVTTFMPNTYLRNINLNTALSYINGTVVNPGEVFSYCDKAGPFNKAGYVFYYEFVGNGVCQIATTTYNAALLGGLEIVKRYPHAKKSLYVAGGLDATVASYSSGWCVDMQFKNTYQYPIYIKAYSEAGQAHVEFWSNHDAKGGLEYTTSSVKIGGRGYKSYLHTWKDGQEIDVHEIATTWYTEE